MATVDQIGSKSKDVGWYDGPVTAVDESARDLLENYSGYEPAEVVPRVNEMRDRIWEIFPWPCVGQFRFLDLSLSRHELYPTILSSIKGGMHFLDVGCCFAQDIRKLVHDGAPAENLWGLELQHEFITLAYEFFRDSTSLQNAHFIAADLLDRSQPELAAAKGSFGVIQLGMILHIWDRPGQIEACRRTIELLSPVHGSMIIGQSIGHIDGIQGPGRGGKRIFKHNPQTFRSMWDELGRLTGTSWTVTASLDEGLGISEQKRKWDDANTRRLVFCVVRN